MDEGGRRTDEEAFIYIREVQRVYLSTKVRNTVCNKVCNKVCNIVCNIVCNTVWGTVCNTEGNTEGNTVCKCVPGECAYLSTRCALMRGVPGGGERRPLPTCSPPHCHHRPRCLRHRHGHRSLTQGRSVHSQCTCPGSPIDGRRRHTLNGLQGWVAGKFGVKIPGRYTKVSV